jgi:hypothetical protein
MFDPRFTNQNRRLFGICSDNPLALHRLWKLHRDFSSPEMLLKTLKAHQSRVEWQVHRIYRSRNQLVHAGNVPPYLESLVLNAFEYYRSAINAILLRTSKEDKKSDIDQVVAEVRIEYEMYKHFIGGVKGGAFDPNIFIRVFR